MKQFGSFYWDGPTLRLNYMIDSVRQRPWFARLRTSSAAERRNLEQEARRRLNEIEVALRRGEFFDSSPYPTYEQMALWYWEKHQSQKGYVKRCAACYASDWAKLAITIKHLGDRSGSEIKREDIKNFRMILREHGSSDKVRRKWTNAYINRIVSAVGQVFANCIKQEIWRYETAPADEKIRYGNIGLCVRLENPIKGLPKLIETPAAAIIPDHGQFKKLLGLLRPVYREMAIIGVHTGLRRRNVVELKTTEIDFGNRELAIESHKGKTSASAKKLHQEAFTILEARLQYIEQNKIQTEYIFCKPDGDYYRDFYTHWREACRDAGIPGFQFRHLRPTYASWRAEEGASLPLLQRALDHTTPTTTGRFYNRTSKATTELLKNQRPVLEPVLVGAPDKTLTNPDRNPDNFLTKWMPVSADIFRNTNFN